MFTPPMVSGWKLELNPILEFVPKKEKKNERTREEKERQFEEKRQCLASAQVVGSKCGSSRWSQKTFQSALKWLQFGMMHTFVQVKKDANFKHTLNLVPCNSEETSVKANMLKVSLLETEFLWLFFYFLLRVCKLFSLSCMYFNFAELLNWNRHATPVKKSKCISLLIPLKNS